MFSKSLDDYSESLNGGEYIDPAQFAIRVLRAYGLVGERVPRILLTKMTSDITKVNSFPPIVLNTIEFTLRFCIMVKLRQEGVVEEELENLKNKMNENWEIVIRLIDQVSEAQDPSSAE